MTEKLQLDQMDQYQLIEHRWLEDPGLDGYLLRHVKTGARIVLLPAEDENKVFYIGFRTPPEDSTGVAHIVEHTVLCGSRDFPVKDPFIELAKGSLNTFLNAMTYPDKTVYPVASCNDTDFKNLMHVYLDAVLYPNIYREKRIFEQEGWHYETKPDTGEITINGVVYNEMKGALSQGDDVLGRQIYASLYPDTPYFHESGGDPDEIPDLTYEQYLEFHSRYYHPSNSFIYMYGNMDMIERLTYLDRAYLSRFDRIDIDSAIGVQEPFTEVWESMDEYSIMADEDPAGKSYLSWNTSLMENGLDGKLVTAFKVLDYTLCDAEGAPVRKALRDKGIGQDVYSLLELGMKQPSFSVISKYTDPERKEEFVSTIEETLRGLVANGFDRKALMAAINYFEFRYREANFGSYPKGLIYGLGLLDSWLYDEKQPWLSLETGKYFDILRKEMEEGYFERLVQKYLLDNTHRSIIVLQPHPGLADEKEAQLKEKMKAYAASLTEEEKQAIIDKEKSLRDWQETPDTEEAKAAIPMLAREDLSRKIQPCVNEFGEVCGRQFISHPLFTNKIHYLSLLFDISRMPARYFPYLGIFRMAFAAMDTRSFGYAELNNEINIYTGGIIGAVNTYTRSDGNDPYRIIFEVGARFLHGSRKDAFRILEELLCGTDYSDRARLVEMLEEERAGMRAELAGAGHATAAVRALSYFSATAAIMDQVSGIEEYRTIDRVCTDLMQEGEAGEKAAADLSRVLTEMAACIFCRDNLIIDDTAGREELAEIRPDLEQFVSALPAAGERMEKIYKIEPVRKNEGFRASGSVQYVCRAGSFQKAGLPFHGALRVLKVILGYEYLWANVRMKGGAYGCMSAFAREGTSYFVSYRDPHLKQTVEVFEGLGDFVRSFDADERTMTKYVIGAVSTMDHPMTPSAYGRYSLTAYLTGLTEEQMMTERTQVLDADAESIRAMAPYLDAILAADCFCAVGSDKKIREHEDMFMTTEALF